MDKRARILVVEDDQTYRETLLDILDVAGFAAQGAATAEEAVAAIDRFSFDVAIVDIMLNGDDTSNRDGVTVLTHLRRLGEGTRSLVLSGQESRPLVRDVLREYGAVDYIDKEQLEDEDNEFLLQKIRAAIANTSAPPSAAAWEALAKSLRGNRNEDRFVYECLQLLGFKGGYATLSSSLLSASKLLVPLLPESAAPGGIRPERVPEVISGRFWSKGQGMAVEILLFGPSGSDVVGPAWKVSERTVLFNRTKSNLSVVVLASPELGRERFLPIPN